MSATGTDLIISKRDPEERRAQKEFHIAVWNLRVHVRHMLNQEGGLTVYTRDGETELGIIFGDNWDELRISLEHEAKKWKLLGLI